MGTNRLQSLLPGSYSLRSTITRASRALLNPLLLRLTSNPNYSLSNTIVVVGAGRSGTTWLAEILNTIPGSAVLFEPFHAARVPEASSAGFPVSRILSPGEGSASQKLFLERVLRGQVVNWWTSSCNPVTHSIRPRVWIVKEVRINYLIEWIVSTFPVRRPVLIIRHPCATIASVVAQGWKPKNSRLTVKNREARQKYPHLEAICRTLEDPFDILAARWCLTNYVPLSLHPRPFHLIAYESLATRGVKDLLPMFEDWRLPVPRGLTKSLLRASSTTKAAAVHGISHQQAIDQWRRKLSQEQVDRILRVVRDFGMDFYSDDLEPDYDRLYGAKSARCL